MRLVEARLERLLSKTIILSLLPAVLCTACPPPAPPPVAPRLAFGDTGLATRVESATAQLGSAGGTSSGRWGPLFLTAGNQLAQPLSFAAGECRLLLGLAGSRISDLDLFLYDLNGRRLDADQERDAHPVVVLCPEESISAVAVLQAYEGDGEAFLGAFRFPADQRPERGQFDFEDVQPPPTPGTETAAESLERMDRVMQAEGFHRTTEDVEEIQLEAQGEVSRPHRVAAGRCLGVALIGDDTAQDLDLRLQLGSRKVGEDRETNRDAHVGYCSDSAVDVRIYASSAQGPAGGTLIYFEAAPEERVFVTPSELPEEPQAEGPAAGPSFEQGVLDLQRRMDAGGYEREGTPFEGTLASGEQSVEQLSLARGNCYEISGLARPNGVRDLDLMLDDGAGNRVAEDREETNNPHLSFCPETAGSYGLRVHAYDGGGGFAVYVYRLGGAIRDLPGVSGRLASAYGRTSAELMVKSFHTVGMPDQRPAEAGRQNAHPLSLTFGSCYAVVALASGDDMDIDLEVRDYMLRGISVDVGGEPDARVFVCPDRSAEFYATVTVARGSGQYMLVLYESKPE